LRGERAGVRLGICYQNRHNLASQALRRAVDQGRFGRLLQAAITFQNRKTPDYYVPGDWHGHWATEGGGALTTQAMHTMDLMLWLMGPAASVQARMATLVHDIEVEDTAAIAVEFASGALGTVAATSAAHTFWSQRLEIAGTEGKAVLLNNRIVEWDFADGAPDRAEVMAIENLAPKASQSSNRGFRPSCAARRCAGSRRSAVTPWRGLVFPSKPPRPAAETLSFRGCMLPQCSVRGGTQRRFGLRIVGHRPPQDQLVPRRRRHRLRRRRAQGLAVRTEVGGVPRPRASGAAICRRLHPACYYQEQCLFDMVLVAR
jgi:hypothetical protein